MSGDKPIRLTFHARLQCKERGATESEVMEAIRSGVKEPVKQSRWMYRLNFAFNAEWQGRHYAIKQVCPIVAESRDEKVVITVYTFYF